MHASEVLDHKADLMVRLENPLIRHMWAEQSTADAMDYHDNDEPGKRMPLAIARANGEAMVTTLAHELPTAECYHVTPDMTRLVEFAASQLDDQDRIDHTLFPTAAGIVRFEGALPMYDVRGTSLRVSWVVWAPVNARYVKMDGRTVRDDVPSETSLIWVFNDHLSEPDDIADQVYAEAVQRGQEHDLVRIVGRWGYIGAESLSEGMRLGPAWMSPGPMKAAEVLADGDVPSNFTNLTRYMHAFFLLLGQTVSDVRPAQIGKPFRKRAERRAIPPRVTVIQLRHKETARREGESLVEWSHRWVVRGHWAWRHCGPNHPLAQEITPGQFMCRVWIAPYVKGPEGKPLVVTDKVYALHR